MSHETGELIVKMVAENRRPSDIMTKDAFINAIVSIAAVGGSSNSVLHLLAIAGRVGVDLTLEDFDAAGSGVPVLANLQPSGKFLMDDLYRAGGLLSLLAEVKDLLRPEPITVTGLPLVTYLDDKPVYDDTVIRPRDSPLMADAGIAVLRGNLAPRGAIIKPSAATPELLVHTGPAVVFDSIEDMRDRIDDPNLDVTPNSILVLRGCGPKGYPGMPEVGNMPIPQKLLEQGVRDMVRISDARMSGTAYGTVVLHVSPEAAAGGPLGLVRDGDMITLDVPSRLLSLNVSEADLAARTPSQASVDAYAAPQRGWAKLYVEHVTQADQGADLDFLVGSSGDRVDRESH
jgi:dihydroxy-acid dehydratase